VAAEWVAGKRTGAAARQRAGLSWGRKQAWAQPWDRTPYPVTQTPRRPGPPGVSAFLTTLWVRSAILLLADASEPGLEKQWWDTEPTFQALRGRSTLESPFCKTASNQLPVPALLQQPITQQPMITELRRRARLTKAYKTDTERSGELKAELRSSSTEVERAELEGWVHAVHTQKQSVHSESGHCLLALLTAAPSAAHYSRPGDQAPPAPRHMPG